MGTQNVQLQVNDAVQTMQENMRRMAERDAQLANLQSRTRELHGASSSFSSSARQMQADYKWQRCRLYILATVLASWIPVFIVRRKLLLWWVPISLALFGAIVYFRNYLTARRVEQYRPVARQGPDELQGM